MNKEYKEILKDCGVRSKDFAMKLHLSYSSYRNLISRGTPRWITAFEFGFSLGEKKGSEKNDPSGNDDGSVARENKQ